ncbi:hypothetical protein KL86DYS1_12280 [uncultured Dysgonomonas sp.]|uniref:Uncharacterized protein n=1 Tax=uncultured Dysgonomonas sp. TaxID=206096 RepID=A0A212JHA6_9BACT|nr:hypothetical protein KL86DYS1_12280 [uncultured Dysgonomonas sp.]
MELSDQLLSSCEGFSFDKTIKQISIRIYYLNRSLINEKKLGIYKNRR